MSGMEGVFDRLHQSNPDFMDLWRSLEEGCTTMEDYWKNIFSNHDYQHDVDNSNSNQQQYGASQYNSPGIIIGAVVSLLSFLIGPLWCACKFSKSRKAEGPREPPPNFVPMNIIELDQEQKDRVTARDTLVRPTPYSVNQSWNTNSGQSTLV